LRLGVSAFPVCLLFVITPSISLHFFFTVNKHTPAHLSSETILTFRWAAHSIQHFYLSRALVADVCTVVVIKSQAVFSPHSTVSVSFAPVSRIQALPFVIRYSSTQQLIFHINFLVTNSY
jgi:hypothetical protein